jgi:hypothetical protein
MWPDFGKHCRINTLAEINWAEPKYFLVTVKMQSQKSFEKVFQHLDQINNLFVGGTVLAAAVLIASPGRYFQSATLGLSQKV